MRFILYIFSILIFSCTLEEEFSVSRPNILLIVADDLGYTDLGCYGGEINTPVIDNLAKNGVLFSRFYAAPLCGPSRAMLLSGNDNHIAGVGVQNMFTDEWGYEGFLTDRVTTIPQVLTAYGYHTYMAGKWHLGRALEHQPHNKGFEHSFSIADGGANHYNNTGFQAAFPVTRYLEDGKEVEWPANAYSTDFFTTKIIEYISSQEDNRPFFAYAAYTSPHWPLQVDEEYWHKYKGWYDEGYEKLRLQRFRSISKLGLIPPEMEIPEPFLTSTPWDLLSDEEKKIEARKMELYAGMVDNLDENIGRLLQYLEKSGKLSNTFVIFMSDNGAAGDDFYNHPAFSDFIQSNYSNKYENMGHPNSFVSYGTSWAQASSVPFKGYKGLSSDGGIIAPMIISGKGINTPGTTINAFTTVLDIAPTIYELAGTDPVRTEHLVSGKSLLETTMQDGDQIHDSTFVYGVEHINKAFLRKGNWKIVSHALPFQKENFELYDLEADIAESTDLKNKYPDKFREMLVEWDKFVAERRIQNPYPGNEEF